MKKFCSKCPFEFHISDYKLIFVFIFPICEILNTKIKEKYLNTYYEFFLTFPTYLSYLFSFIFIIILKIRNSNQGKKEEINQRTNSEVNNKGIINIELDKQNKMNFIKNIIYIIILSGISMAFSHFDYESYHDRRTIGLSYKILIFFLLSYLILKYKYAKHNYITMGINTFTLIIKYAITIVETDSEEYVGKHIWFYFVYALCFCLYFIFGKYYMETYYKTPYFIMFTVGLIISIILIIIALIKYLAGYDSDIFNGFNKNVDSIENIFWFIGDILTQFGMYLGLFITVYYFTPCHTIISENIMEIGYYIIDFNQNEELWEGKNINLNRYIYPFIHLINLICSLIFNEIIILNFCGLDYYTKERIKEREIEDVKNLLNTGNLSELSSDKGSFSN